VDLPDPEPGVAVLTTRLFVHGLRVMASIGVHHRERGHVQPLLIDVELEVARVLRDAIEETFDYSLIQIAVAETIAEGHIDLVEIFAEHVGRRLFAHGAIKALMIRVAKPHALIPHAAAAGVELHLRRD
jgi:dihydroneopterin aldolase